MFVRLNYFIRYSKNNKATALALFRIIHSTIVGALIGSVKMKISINGNKDKYQGVQNKLRLISVEK